jgi:hypothetical protein
VSHSYQTWFLSFPEVISSSFWVAWPHLKSYIFSLLFIISRLFLSQFFFCLLTVRSKEKKRKEKKHGRYASMSPIRSEKKKAHYTMWIHNDNESMSIITQEQTLFWHHFFSLKHICSFLFITPFLLCLLDVGSKEREKKKEHKWQTWL